MLSEREKKYTIKILVKYTKIEIYFNKTTLTIDKTAL